MRLHPEVGSECDKIAVPKLVQLCARKAGLEARKQECNISGKNMTPPQKKIKKKKNHSLLF